MQLVVERVGTVLLLRFTDFQHGTPHDSAFLGHFSADMYCLIALQWNLDFDNFLQCSIPLGTFRG